MEVLVRSFIRDGVRLEGNWKRLIEGQHIEGVLMSGGHCGCIHNCIETLRRHIWQGT
jgi:hypothetical protein